MHATGCRHTICMKSYQSNIKLENMTFQKDPMTLSTVYPNYLKTFDMLFTEQILFSLHGSYNQIKFSTLKDIFCKKKTALLGGLAHTKHLCTLTITPHDS